MIREGHTFPDGMMGSATFSDDRTHRLQLGRIWDARKPGALIVGLNPSKAGAAVQDNTIRKETAMCKALGYGSFIKLNLSSYIATDPLDWKRAGYPMGNPDNDNMIRAQLKISAHIGDLHVICCWGANARKLARPAEVLAMITEAGLKPKAFVVLRCGSPGHPLYLKTDTPLMDLPL